jgi:hypothetical protein
MARDGVANIVNKLSQRGFDPRRIGADAWESRCPVHRGKEHALLIKRSDRQEVVLHCRARQCPPANIASALDLSVTRVYAGTPNWVLSKLSEKPIVPPLWVEAAQEVPRGASASPRSTFGRSAPAAPRAQPPQRCIEPEIQHGAAADSKDQPRPAPEAPAMVQSPASATTGNETLNHPPAATSETAAGKERAVDGLLRIAERARVFRLVDGRLFARLPIAGREEIHGLRSPEFRDWIVDAYLAAGGKLPSKWSLRCAIEALETQARCHGTNTTVSIRVGTDAAGSPTPIYIDLGDPSGRAVAVNASGWSIVDRPPVAFRRPEGLLPTPVPTRDGSIELLRPYVNLTDRDFRLLIAWLAAALRPTGPYPILALYGEQGSAKSTLARLVRMLVDPHSAPLLVEPKSTRDLMITALNGWLLAYDNLSTIPRWLSDGLCLVSTGGAYAGRTEYTTLERTTFQAQRPSVLTGIDEFIRRGDLSDRSLILHLPPIPPEQRRREDDLWQAFVQDQPGIFGALLDAIAGGLRSLPHLEFTKLPRMADFAAASEAIGRGLGWPAGTFLADYEANRREASATQIEDSLVATVLIHHAGRFNPWIGSPADLHSELAIAAGRKAAASARWPKSPQWFTDELRRIAPELRMNGINLTFGRTSKGRFITVEQTNPIKNGDMRKSIS